MESTSAVHKFQAERAYWLQCSASQWLVAAERAPCRDKTGFPGAADALGGPRAWPKRATRAADARGVRARAL